MEGRRETERYRGKERERGTDYRSIAKNDQVIELLPNR